MRLGIVVIALALTGQIAAADGPFVVQTPGTQPTVEGRRALAERLRTLEEALERHRAQVAEAARREELRAQLRELATRVEAISRELAARRAAEQARPQELRDSEGRTLRLPDRITVSFRNAEVRDILELLGRTSGLTIQFAPGVTGNTQLSIDFRDAYAADVFNHVLDAANLRVTVLDEKTVRVGPKQ